VLVMESKSDEEVLVGRSYRCWSDVFPHVPFKRYNVQLFFDNFILDKSPFLMSIYRLFIRLLPESYQY